MSLVNVRFEIAEHYRSTLTETSVSEHGGVFGVDEIKRYAKKAPAIVIGCLGIPEFEFLGTSTMAKPVFAAFCIGADHQRERRGVMALMLAESVAVELRANNWNGSASGTPQKLSAGNLYTSALDGIGVSMWVVRWEQKVELQRNSIATLDDFLTMHSTYDIGQTDDTVDTTDITELPQ